MGRTYVGSSGCGMFLLLFREISQLGVVVGGWVFGWGMGACEDRRLSLVLIAPTCHLFAEAGSGVRVEAQVVGVRFAQIRLPKGVPGPERRIGWRFGGMGTACLGSCGVTVRGGRERKGGGG